MFLNRSMLASSTGVAAASALDIAVHRSSPHPRRDILYRSGGNGENLFSRSSGVPSIAK